MADQRNREHLDRIRSLRPIALGHHTLLAQTCHKCGELQNADQFTVRWGHGRRYRLGTCRTCHYARRQEQYRQKAYQRWGKAS